MRKNKEIKVPVPKGSDKALQDLELATMELNDMKREVQIRKQILEIKREIDSLRRDLKPRRFWDRGSEKDLLEGLE